VEKAVAMSFYVCIRGTRLYKDTQCVSQVE
jgi:hypothetical protein